MKFSGIIAIVAVTSTAFGAVLPRQTTDQGAIQGILGELNPLLSGIETKLCSNPSQDNIQEFENELSSIKSKLESLSPVPNSSSSGNTDLQQGLYNALNTISGFVEKGPCASSGSSIGSSSLGGIQNIFGQLKSQLGKFLPGQSQSTSL